jgi:hypothetical protein
VTAVGAGYDKKVKGGDMEKKTQQIDKARYDRVMWSRVCPSCREHKVVDVVRRSKGDALQPGKFMGSYHACGGPEGHKCWHMSRWDPKAPGKTLYETGRAE